MHGRNAGYDFLDPMIINILKQSTAPLTLLGISFKVNENIGRVINLNVIKSHLNFLVRKKEVSEIANKEDGITHYKV